jgi:hypothetical protein
MKIGPLPHAGEAKKESNGEIELVAGSNDFRKHLEMLAGITGTGENDGGEEDVLGLKDAPMVKFRKSADRGPKSATPLVENETLLAALEEAEEEMNRVESAETLLNEPSIVDLYKERLVGHFGFSLDDPVFALCEIFDEVRRRDLERSAASERFLTELSEKAEQSLAGLEEKTATLERCLKEGQSLERSIENLRKLVERLEEALVSTREEAAAQAAAHCVVQGELNRSVGEEARRMRLVQLLIWVMLVGVVGIGLVVCHLALSLG